MKWWVFLLLPFSLLGQETYVNCGDLTPQNYEVNFDADKVYYWDISGGTITYSNDNGLTVLVLTLYPHIRLGSVVKETHHIMKL